MPETNNPLKQLTTFFNKNEKEILLLGATSYICYIHYRLQTTFAELKFLYENNRRISKENESEIEIINNCATESFEPLSAILKIKINYDSISNMDDVIRILWNDGIMNDKYLDPVYKNFNILISKINGNQYNVDGNDISLQLNNFEPLTSFTDLFNKILDKVKQLPTNKIPKVIKQDWVNFIDGFKNTRWDELVKFYEQYDLLVAFGFFIKIEYIKNDSCVTDKFWLSIYNQLQIIFGKNPFLNSACDQFTILENKNYANFLKFYLFKFNKIEFKLINADLKNIFDTIYQLSKSEKIIGTSWVKINEFLTNQTLNPIIFLRYFLAITKKTFTKNELDNLIRAHCLEAQAKQKFQLILKKLKNDNNDNINFLQFAQHELSAALIEPSPLTRSPIPFDFWGEAANLWKRFSIVDPKEPNGPN